MHIKKRAEREARQAVPSKLWEIELPRERKQQKEILVDSSVVELSCKEISNSIGGWVEKSEYYSQERKKYPSD